MTLILIQIDRSLCIFKLVWMIKQWSFWSNFCIQFCREGDMSSLIHSPFMLMNFLFGLTNSCLCIKEHLCLSSSGPQCFDHYASHPFFEVSQSCSFISKHCSFVTISWSIFIQQHNFSNWLITWQYIEVLLHLLPSDEFLLYLCIKIWFWFRWVKAIGITWTTVFYIDNS